MTKFNVIFQRAVLETGEMEVDADGVVDAIRLAQTVWDEHIDDDCIEWTGSKFIEDTHPVGVIEVGALDFTEAKVELVSRKWAYGHLGLDEDQRVRNYELEHALNHHEPVGSRTVFFIGENCPHNGVHCTFGSTNEETRQELANEMLQERRDNA